MKSALVFAAMMLLALPAFSADYTVRDRSGRTVETWQRRGAAADVRDRSGRLTETWTRTGNRIYVRDRFGRIIGTVGK